MALAVGRTALFLGVLASASVTLAPRSGAAQPVSGGFDDASIPRRGELRVRFGALFDGATDQFGRLGAPGSARSSLGSGLTFDSLGAAQLPAIAETQRLLRDSLGVPIGLSLGTVRTDVRSLVTRIPLRFELGLTSRLALDVRVPIVRTNQAVNVAVNAGGGTGNLGFNPADTRFSTNATTAAQRNAAVQTQVQASVTRLQGLLASCPTMAAEGTPTECAPVIANRAAATKLVADARTLANGIAAVYGSGGTNAGTPFVPIAGSDAQRAVEARLANLRTRFTGFNVTDLAATTAPAGATARIANAGLRRILNDPDFGVGNDSTFSVETGGSGDVEAGARFKWLDTFADSGAPGPGLHARSTAAVAYQSGSPGVELPSFLFDLPLGSGSNGIVVRSESDIGFGRRLSATVAARFLHPFADERTVRIPYLVGSLITPAGREQTVSHQAGREITIEVTPRWAPSASFAVAAHYAMTSKQDDEYTGSFTVPDVPYIGTDTFDAAPLGIGTGGRSQRVGFGATYSTVAAYRQHRTALPLEVSFLHTETIAGSGGVIPRVTTNALLIRFYARLFGRSRRPAT